MRVHGITWIVMYIFGCMTNSYYLWNHIGTHGIHSAELPVQLTSPPESTLFQSAVHGSVFPKWLSIVCINYAEGTSRWLSRLIKENPQWKTFPTLSIFVLQSRFTFWTCMIFFIYFHGDIQKMLWTLIIIFMLVLGSSPDRKSSRDKANISNPKANWGCPPSTVNRTSAEFLQNSRGHPSRHILLGHSHTGRFNAMMECGFVLTTRHVSSEFQQIYMKYVADKFGKSQSACSFG